MPGGPSRHAVGRPDVAADAASLEILGIELEVGGDPLERAAHFVLGRHGLGRDARQADGLTKDRGEQRRKTAVAASLRAHGRCGAVTYAHDITHPGHATRTGGSIRRVSHARAADAPEIAPVRPGEELDHESLDAWLRPRLADVLGGVDAPIDVLQFPNGSANLTYLVRVGAHELVLRRPPMGQVAPGAHDMRREFRVLSRLWRHFHRAPRAYVFCDDPAVLGADFFVMERRRGDVIRTGIPSRMQAHRDVGRRVGFALVDAMAELHGLDPATCDLGDLGRPAGFVERQVDGWAKRWQLARFDDAPAEVDALQARLARHVPRMSRVSIVHNDLKLDNCQFDPADPDRVVSIFDWDMTTLGDPLIDLGTLLNYWPDPSDGADAQRVSHQGLNEMQLPSRADVVARYAERTGADVAAVWWWEAFALWKTVVVVQQLHRRWVRGESTDPRMAHIADRMPSLIAAARAVLDRAGA
jgi:aminoglycoside phosphotransferase (APT) family kinase protein